MSVHKSNHSYLLLNKQINNNVCGHYLLSGKSPVIFSWYKNNVLLIEGDVDVANYTLNRVKMSDSGNYTCVVKNDFGSIQHKFYVDVYSK